ncbi:MAG: DUF2807 domain-containing protein [Bacteroidales bacterium]|nr:DUF2807 domain-containing protein [Bacteroidales bacterium]
MKHILSFLLIVSSLQFSVLSTNAQLIKGNGNVISKERNVSDFTGIDVSNGFDVVLSQGNTENLTITTDENLHKIITSEVVNGILVIKCEKKIKFTKTLKANITLKEINSIKVSGGGDVKTETKLASDLLKLQISGGGDLRANVDVIELNCAVSGGGDVNLSGIIKTFNSKISGGGDLTSEIISNKIICNISGGGDAKITVNEKTSNAIFNLSGGGELVLKIDANELECTLSSGGDARFSGKATNFTAQISGGGDLKAKELITEKAKIEASGGSDVSIYVTKELNVKASGGGDVYYTGNPEIVNIDTSGGSKVHKN